MQLILYENFSKRSNSTRRPSGGYSVEVTLKQNTSVESPTFLIDGVNLSVNYCRWNDSYYFVNDIVLGNRNIYELRCSIDLLATFKEYIQNTSAYIEYSSVGDTSLPDNRIPVRTNPTVSKNSTSAIFDVSGKYYVTITGEGHVGTYRIDDKMNLNRLVFDIDTIYPTSDDVVESIRQLGKNIIGSGSISENIRNCYWMPYSFPSVGDSKKLKVGLYESTCYGREISNPQYSFDLYTTIPWQFSDWRNTSPYTEVYVYLPYIGIVTYPASNLIGVSNYIRFKVSINAGSGNIAYEVYYGTEILGIYSADISCPIPIGSSNINPSSVAGGLIGGTAALINSSTTAGKILGVATASLSSLKTLNTNSGGIGGGAGAGLDLSISVFTVCHGTTVAPSSFATIWGYPYGRIARIGDHSGYIQTQDASVDCPIHEDERAQLNMILNSGFYLE